MKRKLEFSLVFKLQVLLLLFCSFFIIFLGMYSIIFDFINDNQKKNYDLTYLEECYNNDKELFNDCVVWIKEKDISAISHHKAHILEEKSILKDTLYYEFNQDSKQIEDNEFIDKLFDKYDFDEVENIDNVITFYYDAPLIKLVYSKDKNNSGKPISKFWYVSDY